MAKSACIVISLVVVLLMHGRLSNAQEDDAGMYDEDDMGGMDDEMGGMGTGEDTTLKELKSVKDFDEFIISHSDASVIGAFLAEKIPDPKSSRPSDWDDEEDGEWEPATIDNPAFESFKSMSSTFNDYRFAYTTAADVLAKLKTKTGGVYLYRSPRYVSKEHGDRPRERFPADTLSEGGISHWLETKAQPLVGEFNEKTRGRYKSAVLIIFMNLDFKGNPKNIQYVLKRARKVAVGLRGKLAVAVAPIDSMSYELSDYGLTSDKDSDILMAIRGGADHADSPPPKYSASRGKAFSEATLSAFVDAYLAGELTPHKNEDKPEAEGAGADGIGDAKGEL